MASLNLGSWWRIRCAGMADLEVEAGDEMQPAVPLVVVRIEREAEVEANGAQGGHVDAYPDADGCFDAC